MIKKMSMLGLTFVLAFTVFVGTLSFKNESAFAAAYDGQDPNSSGCAKDARTVRSHAIYPNDNGDKVLLELRYSPSCRTAWARIALIPDPAIHEILRASVVRNSDGKRYSCQVDPFRGNSCYTKMVNDAGVTSYAYGEYQYSSQHGIHPLRTGSY